MGVRNKHTRHLNTALNFGLVLLTLFSVFVTAQAQTAAISGTLSGFDVNNLTGQVAHGFEIQIEGATANDLYYTGFGQRYGNGTIVPYATGVYVRWYSLYDPGTSLYFKTTPQHVGAPTSSWQDCYLGGAGYATSGCEALSQGLRYPVPTGLTATGHWLIEDAQNPGNLIAAQPGVAIPIFISYSIAPTTVVSAPPIVVAVIEPPEAPETPEKYGDAQWVKVYKTQLNREATPDDLATISGVVPTDPSQVEVAWDILQASPPSNSNGNQKRNRTQGSIAPDTRSIVRRVETYKYTGGYDAITHKAVCADGTCTAPSTGELGDFIGAHNSAVNLNPDVLSVTKTGAGTVSTTDGKLSCGNNCNEFALKGTTLNLVANPGSNAFVGWTGACSGTQLTCAVSVNGITNVGASFLPQFTLSVSRSNSGTITATPNGNDKAINCGGNCSAKFTQGTAVTLTAIAPAGKTFVNWSSKDVAACNLSTSPTCTATITGNTSIQANFSK